MVYHSQEEGFTKIPNKILEVLPQLKLTVYELKVILVIIRKTNGWNKEADWISLSQFYEATGILKPNISRSLKNLEQRNIIIRNNRQIGLQINVDKWIQKPQRLRNNRVTLRNTHKDII